MRPDRPHKLHQAKLSNGRIHTVEVVKEVKKKIGGLGQHYGGARACCYDDMSIVLIEQVELGNRSLVAKREQFWQHQLRVYVENGGNAHCIRKDIEK